MKQPHIIFIFSDQQHWQACGYQDSFFKTPTMDMIAKDGTIFNQAFCTSPQCSPSRSSLLTGNYPSKTGVMGNIDAKGGEPLKEKTIGKILQENGYQTAYFGKWHLGKTPIATSGWHFDFGVTGPETTNDDEVTKLALDFLQKQKSKDKPFALFLSYNNPHDIYHFSKDSKLPIEGDIFLPESWFHEKYQKQIHESFMADDQGHAIHQKEESRWKRYREIYREKVKLYDDQLSQVVSEIKKLNLYDDSALFLTSDHGDMDTNHKLIYKGPFMYDQLMRVPLVLKLPQQLQKNIKIKKSNLLTSGVDIVPTILALANIIPLPTDGISLLPHLMNQERLKREFIIGQYYSKQKWVNPIRMIRNDHFKYNFYQKFGEELYDIGQDPSELKNIANDLQYQQQKAKLKSQLEQWLEDNNDTFYQYWPTDRNGNQLE